MTEFAASFADLLNHRALVFRRHLDRQLFKRFGDGIAVPMQDDFGLRDLQLIPFAPHLFDQDPEMEFASTGYQESVGAVGFLDAQGDVGFQLLEQPLAKVA